MSGVLYIDGKEVGEVIELREELFRVGNAVVVLGTNEILGTPAGLIHDEVIYQPSMPPKQVWGNDRPYLKKKKGRS